MSTVINTSIYIKLLECIQSIDERELLIKETFSKNGQKMSTSCYCLNLDDLKRKLTWYPFRFNPHTCDLHGHERTSYHLDCPRSSPGRPEVFGQSTVESPTRDSSEAISRNTIGRDICNKSIQNAIHLCSSIIRKIKQLILVQCTRSFKLCRCGIRWARWALRAHPEACEFWKFWKDCGWRTGKVQKSHHLFYINEPEPLYSCFSYAIQPNSHFHRSTIRSCCYNKNERLTIRSSVIWKTYIFLSLSFLQVNIELGSLVKPCIVIDTLKFCSLASVIWNYRRSI